MVRQGLINGPKHNNALQHSFPISLITSLFNSCTDAFAKRWEKAGKAGYYPVYKYDPYSYRKHKIKGGDFREYAEKELEPLTEEQILKHLQGDHFIGIYPLLKDNMYNY